MRKTLTAIAILAAGLLLWAGAQMNARAGIPGQAGMYAEGEVLVKFRDGASPEKVDSMRRKVGGVKLHEYEALGIHRMQVSPGLTVETAIEELMADPDVEYAEPNYQRHLLWITNDTSFSSLWGMDVINAPGAWDIANACAPTIGVVDTGISNHIDLDADRWHNAFENCTDDLDNDHNGIVNDCEGWDFGDMDKDPSDALGHGTHVSGTIGAVGDNGTGVVGVCPSADLMALKIFGSDGTAWVADEVQAIEYARKKGVRLLNLSIGDPNYSFSERDAIKIFGESGGLVIAAAGNLKQDSDLHPVYPAAYNLPNIVSVAASDQTDGLAPMNGDPLEACYPNCGSNWGFFTVDLAAPGKVISSTWPAAIYPNTDYAVLEGTSMAAPHVTGVAALINTVFPELDNMGIKNQLLGSVDEVALLNGMVFSSGRLNAQTALLGTVPLAPAGFTAVTNASGGVLGWTDNATDEDAYRVERMTAADGFFTVINTIAANSVSYLDEDPAASADDYYRVRAIKNVPDSSSSRQVRSPASAAISPALGVLSPPAEQVPKTYYYPMSSGGSDGGCFIATAAYGTSMAPELRALRSFRDSTLMKNSTGRGLVAFYYRNSPPLAESIKQTPVLRVLVRGAISPIVMALGHPLLSAAAILLMATALLIAGMTRKERQTRMTQGTIGEKGFSLMEVMVVVVILGLLVAFVAPRLIGRTDDARVTSAQMQISSFVSAIKLFRNDNGFYPTTEQGLEALVSKPSVGREPKKYRRGGYIDKIPLDPWGSPYVYLSPGVLGEFDIISLGADGVEGGTEYDADITNWD